MKRRKATKSPYRNFLKILCFTGFSMAAPVVFGQANTWKIGGNDSIISFPDQNPVFGTKSPNSVRFISNNLERMRLTYTGKFGVGTANPTELLDVYGGSIQTSHQLISKIPDGISPILVASSTLVNGLNVDLLDGMHASSFSPSNHSHAMISAGNGIEGFSYNGTSPVFISLANTSVSPGIYGSSMQIPTFTVDSKGRITSASSVGVSAASHNHPNMICGTGTPNRLAFWNTGTTMASGQDLFWDNLNIRLGINTPNPTEMLEVSGGNIKTSKQFITTVPNGIAPLVVGSQTRVDNLNADMLDGMHASSFAPDNHSHASLTAGNGIESFSYNGSQVTSIALSNTGVQAGSYGSSSTLTGFTVDGQGRLTSVQQYPISGNSHTHEMLSPGEGINGVPFNGSSPNQWNLDFSAPGGTNGTTPKVARADHSHAGTLTGSGAATCVAYWTGPGELTGNSGLYWDANAGRLGVGTSSPADQLHIFSNNGQAAILLQKSHTNFNHTSLSNWELANNGNLYFRFKSSLIPAYNDAVVFTTSGKVGIGITNPTDRLCVDGTISAKRIKLSTGATSGYVLACDQSGNAAWVSPTAVNGGWSFSGNNIFRNSGNVGIGTTNPSSAKLQIESQGTALMLRSTATGQGLAMQTIVENDGTKAFSLMNNGTERTIIWGDGKIETDNIIKAREILVKVDVFHDYVFEKDYPLMPLQELEQFINKNKHLPDIPAEHQLQAEGMDVGEMNGLLVKKIEELTLYVIELKKENEKLNQKIESVKK